MTHPQNTTAAADRTLTVSWADPAALAEQGLARSGLAFLRAIARGDLPAPPIAELMGFAPIEVEKGRVTFRAVPGEQHYNPIGVVHAGFAATLLDSAMGCAVQTLQPAGTGYTTLELKTNLIRALRTDTGSVTCQGKVVHPGRRVATAEAHLRDEAGRLYAHATSTCLIFEAA